MEKLLYFGASLRRMRLLVLGDIHAAWPAVHKIVNHELRKGDAVLCTGDLQTYEYAPREQIPLFFIGGNHEHRWSIQKLLLSEDSLLRPMLPGQVYQIGDMRVAGLPGVYSEHFYRHPQLETDVRKYYSEHDVLRTKELPKQSIDILLTHEAPAGVPLPPGLETAGRREIREVAEALEPTYHFVGHHHVYWEAACNGTKTILLSKPKHSYLMLDPQPRRMTASMKDKRGFRYEWET